MSFYQRAASFAVLSLCALGLGGISAPGLAFQANAFEADSPAAIATASLPELLNLPNLVPVPDAVEPVVVPPVPAVNFEADDSANAADVASIDTDDEPTFASLAAAVAAQRSPEGLSAELGCLAGAVFYEAKGEPLAGQLAVAEVIINRAKSGRFASTICSVVTQPGQFSFVRGGRIPAVNPTRADYRTAVAVAQVALGDTWDSPASKAMFFHARYVSPRWGKQRVASIGNHVFYR